MVHMIFGCVMFLLAVIALWFLDGAYGAAMWAGFLVMGIGHTLQWKLDHISERLDEMERSIERTIRINKSS